jgi:type VI secretion system VasD/TssJ family lipoprotein
MKRLFEAVFLLAVIILVSACVKRKVETPPQYPYGKGEIQVHLKGEPELNLYQGNPHTLVLCTYQLRDPNAFNQLMDEPGGLSKLLECGRFDPSVTYYKMLVVQPDQDSVEILDRAQGTAFVGFVAGYYYLDKNSVVRLFDIPLDKNNRAKKLFVDLYLGSHEISTMKGK